MNTIGADRGKLRTGDSRPRLRVAVVTARPVYYYTPLYREIARHPGIDLTVVFTTAIGLDDNARASADFNHHTSKPTDLEGYRWLVLPGAERVQKLNGLTRSMNVHVVRHLLRERYDAIWIHGYSVGSNFLAAITQAMVVGGDILLRDDQHLRNPRATWKQATKRLLLPILFRRLKGLYVGSLNREWLEFFGVRPENLFFVPHTVDNDAIQESIACLRPRRDAIRASFGIHDPDVPVILLSGRLVWEKDHPTLLRAFDQVRSRHLCVLLVVGDGPERASIEAMMAELKLPDVILSGQVDQDRMMEALAAADIHVLPSKSETWGLVVNEAMNAGLPVVVSDHVGCSIDLVHDNENGWIVASGDSSQLAAALETLVEDPAMRERFGCRSLDIISGWTYQRAAAGALQALGLGESSTDCAGSHFDRIPA